MPFDPSEVIRTAVVGVSAAGGAFGALKRYINGGLVRVEASQAEYRTEFHDGLARIEEQLGTIERTVTSLQLDNAREEGRRQARGKLG